MKRFAKELVALQPELILTSSTAATAAMLQQTHTIPIIFVLRRLRWWFVCPHLNRRVRKLYLPLGGRHFWSRRAYELAYVSQRETKFDRALRRARKLRLSLGGDPADDEYPEKPPRMRWATYNRLLDKLRAADGVADERLRRVLINAQMSGFGG